MSKKKHFILPLLLFLVFSYSIVQATTKSSQFIQFMLPKIYTANLQVIKQRQKLLVLANAYKQKQNLSKSERHWLKQLAEQYKLSDFDFQHTTQWKELINRVDTLPASLILAQAINESAWGTSRFARQANNYFGQWCYRPGCGLIPRQRRAGAKNEVQKFATPEASVAAYLLNINTHRTYRELRSIRQTERKAGNPLDSLDMAEGLSQYSQLRGAYVRMIQHLIESYELQQYDHSHKFATEAALDS